MIERSRDVPDGASLRADVCVVGAGMAGLTLALALEGSGLSVLVLESGNENADPNAQDLADGDVDGNVRFNLDTWRIRRFGGSSHHWAGLCQPLRAC
ncbi:MAG: FAD-dependent oxidoreductase, partial [Sandaracinaceae bacterium]